MATEHLKCGLSELRYIVGIKYTSGLKTHKNNEKIFIKYFMLITYLNNILDILDEIKYITKIKFTPISFYILEYFY